MWCKKTKITVLFFFLFSTIASAKLAKISYKNAKIYTNNAEAFTAKYNRIGQAKKNLDLSYFIIDSDYSSSLIAERILQRIKEVRDSKQELKVRILVDYFMSEMQLPFLALLDQNPNIEVRRYGAPTKEWTDLLAELKIDGPLFVSSMMAQNGAGLKKSFANAELDLSPEILKNIDIAPEANPLVWIAKVGQQLPALLSRTKNAKKNIPILLKGVTTFLQRTHHKLLLVDGNCFQMGGRNLSDEYHAPMESKLIQGNDIIKARDYPFVDLDVSTCLANPVAYDKSPLVKSFNELWTNKRVVTLAFKYTQAEKDLDTTYLTNPSKVTQEAKDAVAKGIAKISVDARQADELLEQKGETVNLKSDVALPAVWVEQTDTAREITQAYIKLLGNLGQGDEASFANAYFFMDPKWQNFPWVKDTDRAALGNLHKAFVSAAARGAKISLYTNSLKTTDLAVVNSFAYAQYRTLLNAGKNGGAIKLYELNDKQGKLQKRSSLHMKGGYVRYYDSDSRKDKLVFLIGSYNLDPRSHARDTNNALVFAVSDAQKAEAQKNFDAGLNSLSWIEISPTEATDPAKNIISIDDIEKLSNTEEAKGLRKKLGPVKVEI